MQLQNAATTAMKELASCKAELLFWILLLMALRALGSVRPSVHIAGLVETILFLWVSSASIGKLRNLGLEFAYWNAVDARVATACISAGLLAGTMVILVATHLHQSVGTLTGWSNAVLVVVPGPILEEIIFRGYLLTAALRLAKWLSRGTARVISVLSVALVFSIAHCANADTTAAQVSCIAFTGCLYGCLRMKYQSTLAAALAHGSYNLSIVVCCFTKLF